VAEKPEIDEKKYLHLIPRCLKTNFRKWPDLWDDMHQDAFFGLRYGIKTFNPTKIRPGTSFEEAVENHVYQSIRDRAMAYLTSIFMRPSKQNYLEIVNGEARQAYAHCGIDEFHQISYEKDFSPPIESILAKTDMPEKMKTIVSMWCSGLSFPEISQAVGCSRQYAHTQFKKALRAIKAQQNIFF